VNLHDVIQRPLVTEKSNIGREEQNLVTFAVDPRANKHEIRRAVEELFRVRVLRVRTSNPGRVQTVPHAYRVMKSWNSGDEEVDSRALSTCASPSTARRTRKPDSRPSVLSVGRNACNAALNDRGSSRFDKWAVFKWTTRG